MNAVELLEEKEQYVLNSISRLHGVNGNYEEEIQRNANTIADELLPQLLSIRRALKLLREVDAK